jgi:molybdopterin/thiamine biosynthesis adenylyltransferase
MASHSKIFYLDRQDILDFFSGNEAGRMAYAYEWEGEGVVHIHLAPLRHRFGHAYPVTFVKKPTAAQQRLPERKLEVRVSDAPDGPSAVLYERVDGEYIPRDFCYIPSRDELYSRSRGLLEVDALRAKRVVIVGLGSFGSQIAIELAKAGVGVFVLFDFDRVELHNLARHTCCTNDLGRLKTDAVEDAILGKNPYAVVRKYPVDIRAHLDVLEEEIRQADLVICATDNNASRYNISEALVRHARPGLFGRAITRAEGGDVFRYRPGGPCYGCLVGAGFLPQEEITNVESARRDGRIPAYASAEEADAVVQVGLSSDIQPICNMMVKLALVELSRGLDTGIRSLEEDFVYDCYVWANRREKNYRAWHPFYQAGKDRTIMRWYGVRVPRDPGCAICSDEVVLDTSGIAGFTLDLDDLALPSINE